MNREQIMRMAREAGLNTIYSPCYEPDFSYAYEDWDEEIEKFAALVAAAEREKVATWMMAKGYATGHGDSTEDLLTELDWQIAENWTRGMVNGVHAEREVIAQSLDKQADLAVDEIDRQWAQEMAAAVRARGKTK